MALLAKEGGTDYPLIPQDVYQAVCYAVIDVGSQYSEKWEKSSHQAVVIWEIPSERIEIERDGVKMDLPKVVSKKYTLSLGDKANLKKDLESWRGKAFTEDEKKGFDIQKLIGVNCMIQIIHNKSGEKTYANIASILPLYKGMKPVEPENPIIMYSLYDGEPPKSTPKWIIELIHASSEWIAAHTPETQDTPSYRNDEDGEDRVPF